jgi:MerR family transcriptional regulator, copper efflux regulator
LRELLETNAVENDVRRERPAREAGMTALPLIACSLDAFGQQQRLAEWRALLADAVRREERADDVRYSFVGGDDLESRLRTLAAAEKTCCALLDFNVTRAGDEITMTVTAPPEAADVLRSIFSAAYATN